MKLLSKLMIPALLCAGSISAVNAQSPISNKYSAYTSANCAFGDAAGFAVLAATTVTNTSTGADNTVVNGNVGVYPGTAITGFIEAPTTVKVTGSVYCATGVMDQNPTAKAKIAATGVYNAMKALAPDFQYPAGVAQLAGATLQPGVYNFPSSADIADHGTLMLDNSADPNAVFIFQMGSTITANTYSKVIMTNGKTDPNIYWIVGSSATIGVGSNFEGNVIANTAITINTDATTDGRLFALGAAVTMQFNKVTPTADSDGDGVPDCLDAYPNDPKKAFNNYSTAATIAFEDLWPSKGDFDMNDVVMAFSYNVVTSATNQVSNVIATYTLQATGGAQKNAFMVEFPIPAANLLNLKINGMAASVEAGQTNAVIQLYKDMRVEMPSSWNTIVGNIVAPVVVYNVTFDVAANTALSTFGTDGYNPFIMNMNGASRLEVHLPTKMPTNLADKTVFGTIDDMPGSPYISKDGMPFAMSIPTTSFDYPVETKDISTAYPRLIDFAAHGGTTFLDWFSNTATGYRVDANIFRTANAASKK